MNAVKILLDALFSVLTIAESAQERGELVAVDLTVFLRKTLNDLRDDATTLSHIPTIRWGVGRTDDPLDELEGRISALEAWPELPLHIDVRA